jgi:hypothetical protein
MTTPACLPGQIKITPYQLAKQNTTFPDSSECFFAYPDLPHRQLYHDNVIPVPLLVIANNPLTRKS